MGERMDDNEVLSDIAVAQRLFLPNVRYCRAQWCRKIYLTESDSG